MMRFWIELTDVENNKLMKMAKERDRSKKAMAQWIVKDWLSRQQKKET